MKGLIKRSFAVLLSVMIILTQLPTVIAEENDFTWFFDKLTCELVVEGTGEMPSFEPGARPWEEHLPDIRTVTIAGELTNVSGFAFLDCDALAVVNIEAPVETIYNAAFENCYQLTDIFLPSSLRQIEDCAFANCEKILNVFYFGSEDEWCGVENQSTAIDRASIIWDSDNLEVLISYETDYLVGDEFIAKVYVHTPDWQEYYINSYTVIGYDPYMCGDQEVIISFGPYKKLAHVCVNESIGPVEYTIEFENLKTEYNYSEQFYVEVYKCIGDERIFIPLDECTVEGYDCCKPGMQTVTIQYEDFCETFEVFVGEKGDPGYEEIPYSICIENVKTEYEYGEDFYAEVYLDFEDGTREQIFDYKVEGFDSYTPGEQTVIIYCRDFTYECIVFVNEEPVEESIQWQLKGSELVIEYYGEILNFDKVAPIFEELGDLTKVRNLTIKGNFYAIETQTFSQLTALYAANIEADVEAIHNAAFENCNALRTVLLSKEIEAIDDGAFHRPLMNLLYQGSEEEYMSKDFYESFTNNTAATAKIYYNCAVVYMYVATNIKTNYAPGEEFFANYYSFSGPTIKEITSVPVKVEGFDSTITGWQTVTLRYADRSTEVEVFVGEEEEPVPTITIEFANVKTEYNYGEEFYVEVYEYSADGVVTQITDYEVEGFDPYAPGKQSVTVSYGDSCETYIVTVYDAEEPEEPEEPSEPEYSLEWCLDYNELTITYYGEVLNYERLAEVYEGIGSASNVRTLILKGDIGTIESSTFTGLTSMGTVYIEANVKTIESTTFNSCYNLKTIFISDSVEFIDPNAFTSYLTNFMYRGSEDEFNSRSDAFGILNGAIAWGTMFYNSAYLGMYAVANVKTEYALGEEFYAEAYRTEGGDLVANSLYPIEITGFDSNNLGYQDVTLSYDGYSATFTVYVGEPTYNICFDYVKTEYSIGEDFYAEIYINYSDGKSERVYDYVVEGFDNQTPGWHEVSVTYDNYTEYYDVYVAEKAIVAPTYEVTFENVKLDYEYGEDFYAEVYMRYSDGTAERIYNFEVEGYNAYAPGKQTVKVSYNNYYKNYIVTVNQKPIAEPEITPVVTVSKEKCRIGNTVDVVVSISQNTGFANLGLEIEYDRALKLVAVNANKEVGATFTPAQALSAYPYNLGFDSVSNNSFNGDLVTMTFEVPEGTVAGEYFINVDFYKGRNGIYVDGSSVNYDENGNPLFLEYANGSVTAYDYIPGDINNDGTVTNKDGTALLRYLAAWELEELNPDALDTDGDGTVTNKDGTRLLRYLANWDVEIH